MQRCDELRFSEEVEPLVLDVALSRASKWAAGAYGSDCVVCAELHSESDRTFTLHVTSPNEGGSLVNTSATLTFSKAAGRLLEVEKYHSCQLRRDAR